MYKSNLIVVLILSLYNYSLAYDCSLTGTQITIPKHCLRVYEYKEFNIRYTSDPTF